MISPARAHFLRASAAAASAAAAEGAPQNASQYELMLLKLAEDRRRLKDIKAIERKIAVKRELLPSYMPWVEGVLQAGRGGQDDVFVTVMVWLIDVGDLAGALPLARYALDNKLTLPDQYQRSLPDVLAEEAATQALKDLPGADLPALLKVELLTADEDMHDQIRAKLHKAIGYAMRLAAGYDEACKPTDGDGPGDLVTLANAQSHLREALRLHDGAGVKKDIERMAVLLKNSADPDKGAG